MSMMSEWQQLFTDIEAAWARRVQAVVVVLIDVKGSAYRLPGSKMVMTSDGNMYGSVSGGCLEPDLYEWAQKVFTSGEIYRHTYDLSDTEIWSLGIGCKGDLQFAFLPVSEEQEHWQHMRQLVERGENFNCILHLQSGRIFVIEDDSKELHLFEDIPSHVIVQSQRMGYGRAKIVRFGEDEYFIDHVQRSERLLIAGAGLDAVPVAQLAHQVGFDVAIVDRRTHFNNSSRFPKAQHIHDVDILINGYADCWWLIMNHHQQTDEEMLKRAIEQQAKFIGVLGPIYRTEEMLQQIGYTLEDAPIYAPVGLQLGAETMDEVACSIVAQLMALRAKVEVKPLHRQGKIHV